MSTRRIVGLEEHLVTEPGPAAMDVDRPYRALELVALATSGRQLMGPARICSRRMRMVKKQQMGCSAASGAVFSCENHHYHRNHKSHDEQPRGSSPAHSGPTPSPAPREVFVAGSELVIDGGLLREV